MALTDEVAVLLHSHVSPPQGTVADDKSLPLTLYDMMFLLFSNIQRLIFYDFRHSESYFVDNVIPKLKDSLSRTLKHYYMLAGSLTVPSDSSNCMPEIRYKKGDSVSLIFARSDSMDFNNFLSNKERNCGEYYPLIPQLSAPSLSPNSKIKTCPVLALQVTLFPNVGICVGVTNHHVVGDANTIFRFMKEWAALSKLDKSIEELQPFYDRTVINDPKGLAELFWRQLSTLKFENLYPQQLPTTSDKVRSTFVVGHKDIQRLKKLVISQRPELVRLSTFTVICAYVWLCMVKSYIASEDKVDEDELEHFGFVADCRGRLNPPLPENYFGNCLVYCLSSAKIRELIGEGGFVTAVDLIVESMNKRLYNPEGVLKDAENWLSDMEGLNMGRVVGVAGSPRYNYYDLDFGFGKVQKFEFASIEMTGAMSLSGCRESCGDIEVGLCFTKKRMDAFAAMFTLADQE